MKKYNILIVDDLFVNRLLLSEFAKSLGHDSTEADNGQEAIDYLSKNDYDLVLMDIEMPVMNGIDACKHIRNNFPDPKNQIPVVALTAHNPKLFPEEFDNVGFTELITKPYSLDKIIELLEKLN